MKVNREVTGKIRKYIAGIVLFVGIFMLLGTIFVSAPDVPAGDLSYQKLWIGRMAWLFVGCSLIFLCVGGEKRPSFSLLVMWALILCGGIEAVWGFCQLYGWSVSHHSLYALTGSFYNPGPYSGYLAMILPLCLSEWLDLRGIKRKTLLEYIQCYVAFGTMLLIFCLLPAGMSRSAWLAAAVSCSWVCWVRCSWGNYLKSWWKQHRRWMMLGSVACGVVAVLLVFTLFHLKANSASGRLLMWKVSCRAIAEKPLWGYGRGNFVEAYGDAQEQYFAAGNYLPREELVAGSPEYAFNEYLQLAVEYGIPVLVLVLGVIAFAWWRGLLRRQIALCGGILSVLVFTFSSYPIQIPAFALAFLFMVAACLIERSWRLALAFIAFISWLGTHSIKDNTYQQCRKWTSCQMLYKVGAYRQALKEYEQLYPALKGRGAFLFEYGHCLHKLEEYAVSTQILQEAEKRSCDPMILNIIGKNYQALKQYKDAEKWLVRSTHRLPGRIYPYYLLAKLYAEPDFHHPEKLKKMVEVVLTKEPKVQSTAIREMREEVKKLK